MITYILDALIALSLTQSIGTSHAPLSPPPKVIERSVWGQYDASLYKLQACVANLTKKCDRRGFRVVKAGTTLANELIQQTNKETKNVSR
jgi:hypothetical protein